MKIQSFIKLCVGTIVVALAAGCASHIRSISNSGYSPYPGLSQMAGREVTELDVLGIDPGVAVSEEEIVAASDHAQRIRLKPGSSIMVVQSGAEYPDPPMLEALDKHFTVIPFTGFANIVSNKVINPSRPSERTRNIAIVTDSRRPVSVFSISDEKPAEVKPPEHLPATYSRLLRLAAARSGATTLVCYWGILESANEKIPTKVVSWVPVVSWVVPDEREHMRIRVKMAVVDVRSGNWTVFTPPAIEAKSFSTSPRREVVDQKQVESLKTRAYQASVRELMRQYVD